jgi:hypothetical protein
LSLSQAGCDAANDARLVIQHATATNNPIIEFFKVIPCLRYC